MRSTFSPAKFRRIRLRENRIIHNGCCFACWNSLLLGKWHKPKSCSLNCDEVGREINWWKSYLHSSRRAQSAAQAFVGVLIGFSHFFSIAMRWVVCSRTLSAKGQTLRNWWRRAQISREVHNWVTRMTSRASVCCWGFAFPLLVKQTFELINFRTLRRVAVAAMHSTWRVQQTWASKWNVSRPDTACCFIDLQMLPFVRMGQIAQLNVECSCIASSLNLHYNEFASFRFISFFVAWNFM